MLFRRATLKFSRMHLLALPSVCAGGHLASVRHHVLLLGLDVAVRYTAYLIGGKVEGKSLRGSGVSLTMKSSIAG